MINNKINNLISSINANNNYNYEISEYNGIKNKNFEKNILDYNYRLNNKTKNIQEYSAVISMANKNIHEQNSSSNINQLKRKKNISLNKIQNEIKMIEMKLRSDIIKNKKKQLNNISEDNKSKIPFSMKKFMNITNKIYNNNNSTNNNYFNYMDKNSFVQQRNKERKIYKIRKLKYNDNNDSRNFIFIKKKIDSKNNKINNTAQNENSSKSSIFDKSAYLNNNSYKSYSDQNQYQNNTSKINKNALKIQYRKAINAKINNLLENKKKFNIVNMKNIFNSSYKDDERF